MNKSKQRRVNAEATRVRGECGTPHPMGNRRLRRHGTFTETMTSIKQALEAAPEETTDNA